MSGIVPQRHKHLPLTLPGGMHIVLHDRQPAGIAVLITQALKEPLRRVPLLRRAALIPLQDLIDGPDKRIQLGPLRWLVPPIPGGTENDSIFATVRGSMPNRRAASRRLIPSI